MKKKENLDGEGEENHPQEGLLPCRLCVISQRVSHLSLVSGCPIYKLFIYAFVPGIYMFLTLQCSMNSL